MLLARVVRARVQTTGRPSQVASDHAPQHLSGSSRSKMGCQRDDSPARALWADRVPRSQRRSGPPGARRASTRGDLITRLVPGTPQISVSVTFIMSLRTPPLVFSCASHRLARIPSPARGPLMHRGWRRHGDGHVKRPPQCRWCFHALAIRTEMRAGYQDQNIVPRPPIPDSAGWSGGQGPVLEPRRATGAV
jgi:hypothetical protein